jgi:hypothetical protein
VTPFRFAIVVLMSLLLAVLFGWQWQREQLVKSCVERGGSWDGGTCGPPRIRPILRRDLHRS